MGNGINYLRFLGPLISPHPPSGLISCRLSRPGLVTSENYVTAMRVLFSQACTGTFPRPKQDAQLPRPNISGGAAARPDHVYSPRPRFFDRLHISHLLILALAFFGERELYEKLRAAYNPMHSSGTPPIPPFEEWQGISSCCDHIYCRWAPCPKQRRFLLL